MSGQGDKTDTVNSVIIQYIYISIIGWYQLLNLKISVHPKVHTGQWGVVSSFRGEWSWCWKDHPVSLDSHSNWESFWEALGASRQTNHSLISRLRSYCSSLSVRGQQNPHLLHPQIPANLMKKADLLSIWCNISVWFSIRYTIRDGSEKVRWMCHVYVNENTRKWQTNQWSVW